VSYSESFFEQNFIETIRVQTDIVALVSEYLSLKKSGQNFVGLCPFHTEKSPSFAVNPAKQFFHCFGCSAGGDIFHFLSKIEQISFSETVRRLAQKAGIAIPPPRAFAEAGQKVDKEAEAIYQINELAAETFHRNLMDRPEAQIARKYLEGRGISKETIKGFLIGFALPGRGEMMGQIKTSTTLLEKACLIKKGETGFYDYFRNRIIFPIRTLQEKIVGFGGRALDETAPPKYLNSPETPVFTKGKHLFGLNLARGKKSLIVVEGYFDAISLHQAGFSNVVATLGTAMTQDHVRLIRRFSEKVTLLFDPDRAGVEAAVRVAPLFIENELEAKVVSLPKGLDPDLFIRKEGKDAFVKKLESGETILSFVIRQAASSSSDSVAEKTKAIHGIFSLIKKIPNQGYDPREMERGYYLKIISDAFGISERDVLADFGKEQKENSLPSGATIISSPKSSLPEDEKTLLALLIQDQLDCALLSSIFPDDFTTPQLQNIVHYFWDSESASWFSPKSLSTLISDADPFAGGSTPGRDVPPVFSALAVLEIANENRDTLIADCVKSLHKKRLKREIIKTQTQLKSAERGGDRVLAESLQHTFFNFKKELSQIG
jgi:DNA primase